MKLTPATLSALVAALSCFSAPLAWGDAISLGNPNFAGDGCAPGTASAVLSPDATTLSVLFDDFAADTGGVRGQDFVRKSCTIGIPIHVPQGYTVSVFEVDFRGYQSLPVRGISQFDVTYSFAGQKQPRFMRRFRGPLDQDFTTTNRLKVTDINWSPCGKDTVLNVDSSIIAVTNNLYEEALSTVDSADVKGGIIYQMSWKRCN